MNRLLAGAVLAAGGWIATAALAQTQGVSPKEIVVGSIQDLSGPGSVASKHARFGMLMRVNELNEQGGIHGRKIKLLVEDHAFDPKRAVLATQKLVFQEKIFALIGHFGSPHNIASMPILFERNVINFQPLAAARDLHHPPHPLKTQFLPNNFDQMRVAATQIVSKNGLKTPCMLYQDDEFGLENLRGAEDGLKTMGMQLAEKVSYKRGATDFSSQVVRMKGARCDIVFLASFVRETVGAMAEARKIDFNPVFVGGVGSYNLAVPRLGGKDVDGLYATMTAQIPYADAADQAIRDWVAKYTAQFGEPPTEWSTYGYHIADSFARVADKAGPNLTMDSFTQALDGITIPSDMFGNAEERYTAANRLGNSTPRISQLKDGRWSVVVDYQAVRGTAAKAPTQ